MWHVALRSSKIVSFLGTVIDFLTPFRLRFNWIKFGRRIHFRHLLISNTIRSLARLCILTNTHSQLGLGTISNIFVCMLLYLLITYSLTSDWVQRNFPYFYDFKFLFFFYFCVLFSSYMPSSFYARQHVRVLGIVKGSVCPSQDHILALYQNGAN